MFSTPKISSLSMELLKEIERKMENRKPHEINAKYKLRINRRKKNEKMVRG